MNKLLIFLFVTFTISGTMFGQVPNIETGVSKELAKWRTANYSDIKIKLDLTLEKMSPVIKGSVEISLFNRGDLIILDWRKLKGNDDLSKISNLSVNGRTAYFEELSGHLILKEGVLKNRPNAIRFDFTSPITGGASVTRYIDKEDNAEYIYSPISANNSNTAFPQFEQPDLKAKFQLHLVVSEKWKAVSNAEIVKTGVTTLDKKPFPPGVNKSRMGNLYIFLETEPISTGDFAFAAGDFAEFKDTADIGPVKTAPIGSSIIYEPRKNPNAAKVYVRKSQAEKFQQHAAEFFRLNRNTDKSAKLDIILMPEIFNIESDHDGIKFVPESSVFK